MARKAVKLRQGLSFIMTLLMVLSVFTMFDYVQYGEESVAWAEAKEIEGTYLLEKRGNQTYFVNYVDGYSLEVDRDMKVDMSKSAICAVLENQNKRIEIYKQYVGKSGSRGYINYSNKFLKNSKDHFLEYNGGQQIGNINTHLVSWNRKKLTKIENDKNYYLVIDIEKGHYIYTIFVKANAPIGSLGGYTYLVQDFVTFEPSRPGVIMASKVLPKTNWNYETVSAYNKMFYENPKVSWGLFNHETSYGKYDKVNFYETTFQYRFPIVLHYTDFLTEDYVKPLGQSIGSYIRTILNNAKAGGKIVELTFQTNWSEDGNMVYAVLDGKHDVFLNEYAKAVADFGSPVMFRLGNEMNGDWCPYSSYNTSRDPQIFNEFYKYIYKIFQKHNAKNVMWVWNPNGKSFPDYKWNADVMYYPGDEYVDIIGLTAYNTGAYYARYGEKWQTFDEIYSWVYNRYDALFNQPFMITEFSCANHGGDKNAWIEDAFNSIHKYKRIRAAIWWDGADRDPENGNIARSYYIDETPELLETFKRNINK